MYREDYCSGEEIQREVKDCCVYHWRDAESINYTSVLNHFLINLSFGSVSIIFSLVLHDWFTVKKLAVNLWWTLLLNARWRNLKDPLSLCFWGFWRKVCWSGFVSHSSLCSEIRTFSRLEEKVQPVTAYDVLCVESLFVSTINGLKLKGSVGFSVWMRLNTVIFSVMIHFSESIRFRNRFVRISYQESSCVWFCKFWGLSIVNSFNCVILTRVYVYDSSTPPISQSSDLRMWSESVRLNDHFESVQ